MKTNWSGVAVFVATMFGLAVAKSHAGEVNLVVNGGFETPDGIHGYRVFHAGVNLGGWTIDQGTVEITASNYWQSAEGRQSLDLNGIFEQIGTISQDIATQAGQRYRLRFAFAGNPAGEEPRIKSLKVFWAGKELEELRFDITGHSLTNMGWQYHEYIVTAAGPASRLRFQSTVGSFCGPTLDDISVTPLDQFTSSPLPLPLTAPARAVRPVQPASTIATVVDNAATAAINSASSLASTPLVETELSLGFYPCLTIKGNVGRLYQIECAESVTASAWLALTNFVLPSSPFIWVDTISTNSSRRFYRAGLMP